jgi:hypothetical protein
LFHINDLLQLGAQMNKIFVAPTYLLDKLLAIYWISLILQFKLKHYIQLVEQIGTHFFLDQYLGLQVPLMLRFYLSLRVLRIKGLVDLGVFTVCILDTHLLVNE